MRSCMYVCVCVRVQFNILKNIEFHVKQRIL